MCRNGEYPIKGIDTEYKKKKKEHGLSSVEMENTRLRELTQICFLEGDFIHPVVEMENTRLRELTQGRDNCAVLSDDVSRNGEYPIKGIDTSAVVIMIVIVVM